MGKHHKIDHGDGILLNDKQERFCQNYVKTLNITKAYLDAGYNSKTERSASKAGSHLLENPMIKARVAQLQAVVKDEAIVKVRELIEELKTVAFCDIADYFNKGNVLKDLNDIPKVQRRAISKIKIKQLYNPLTKEKEGEMVEISFHDKLKAIEMIGRHLGIFLKEAEGDTKDSLVDMILKIEQHITINNGTNQSQTTRSSRPENDSLEAEFKHVR